MSTEKEILDCCHVIAVVGLSADKDRPSYHVASYLKGQGYKIIPVNPKEKSILAEVCYPDIASIPEKIDAVDIFRRSKDVLPVVQEAISAGAKAVWMQEGVVNEEAADLARNAGLLVVMDKCMLKEHYRLSR